MQAEEIEIVLCNPQAPEQELSLFFCPLTTPIAHRYLEAMRECASKGFEIRTPDRFYNFPGTHKNAAWIAGELNRCIGDINRHEPSAIPHRAELHMTQEFLNLLHSYFEKYRGGVLTPGAFYQGAPADVQQAIDDLNLLVHRYEDCRRNEVRVAKGLRPFAQAVLTFGKPMPRYPLEDEDYLHFNRKVVFGSLYINYCELGKPIWDVFKDRDEVVGDKNIRPLRYYSADTFLNFAPSHGMIERIGQRIEWLQFHLWWNRHARKLAVLGFSWNDPKNSIGNITVARLNHERGAIAKLSEDQVVALIGRHQRFKRVDVH